MLKRGQSSFEYILLLIVVLIVVVPLLFYSVDKAGDSFRRNNVEDALGTIALATNDLAELGAGNKKIVKVQIPVGVEDFDISDRELIYTLNGINISVTVNSKVIGELPINEGLHSIQLRSLSDGTIVIGDYLYIYDLLPECIVFPPGPEGSYVEIIGFGFEDGAVVYVNGEIMSSQYVEYRDFELIILELSTGIFSGNAYGKEYDVVVENPSGARSNEETFKIYSNINQCGN